MSLKTQKIIKFIPIINLVIFFVWSIEVFKNRLQWKRYVLTLFKAIGVMVIISLLTVVVVKLGVPMWFIYIGEYLAMLAMLTILIKHQENFLYEKNKIKKYRNT